MRKHAVIFFASGAYLGYAPVASGTFGTLAGVALYPLFDRLRERSVPLYLAAVLLLVAGAIWVAGEAEALFGEEDSGKITIDEIAGYLVATLFIPLTLGSVAASFFLFRLFDVLKPPPARAIDQGLGGGAGVVLDDVFAGIYANLALRLGLWWFG